MGIIIGTGEWDNTRHESLRLSGILNSLARRPEMMGARLELLARHAALLSLDTLSHALISPACLAQSLSQHITPAFFRPDSPNESGLDQRAEQIECALF